MDVQDLNECNRRGCHSRPFWRLVHQIPQKGLLLTNPRFWLAQRDVRLKPVLPLFLTGWNAMSATSIHVGMHTYLRPCVDRMGWVIDRRFSRSSSRSTFLDHFFFPAKWTMKKNTLRCQ